MALSQRARKRSSCSAKALLIYSTVSVAAGQAVEHYEMARYGALAGGLPVLGNMRRPRKLLNQTLQEEMNAEKLLTQIAKSNADKTAATKKAPGVDERQRGVVLAKPSPQLPQPIFPPPKPKPMAVPVAKSRTLSERKKKC